jgi:hypothetical protein
MTDTSDTYSGGCQCGAVRFRADGAPTKIGICHCRMCQKAIGSPFGVYAVVPLERFTWTRGAPASWKSSSRAWRDFCATCGTPLAYCPDGGTTIELQTAVFDRHRELPPTYEVGTESKLAWLATLPDLPGKTTLQNVGPDLLARIESHQHPDHDT